ncbi:hypothetical protein [Pseudoalteromonas mariniglutinosa]|uniref:hypothetical protein n=1 Tax=Pseudoalteromonas mariniglutinosa TaxID=206042 RepID=UPI00384A7B5B
MLDQQRVGRLSRIDAMQNQQMVLSYKTRLDAKLKAINTALANINSDPEYGVCHNVVTTFPLLGLLLCPM